MTPGDTTLTSSVVILDYGMGNLHSVARKLRELKADPTISADPAVVAEAEKLVLPGVGHFGKAMENLRQRGLVEALDHAVRARKAPILGICLGMQLMTRHSQEGDAEGLGWIDAEVVRFQVRDALRFKIPHIGWNQIERRKDSALLRGIADLSLYYFVHSYHCVVRDRADVLTESAYELTFTSAFERDNVFGVQYHPEKSHDAGDALLRNFISL